MTGRIALLGLLITGCTVAHKRGGDPDAVVEAYRNSGQIQMCYKQSSQNQHPPIGNMVLAWKVDQTGWAKKVRVVRSEVNNPQLERCLLENLSLLKFPPQPIFSPALVEFELAFDPAMGGSSKIQ